MKKVLSVILSLMLLIAVFYGAVYSVLAGVTEDGFEYDYIIGGIRITGYNGVDTQVSVPAEIEGSAVVCIGNQAFSGCTAITSVSIPDTVTSIGRGAFWICASLKGLTIPSSVTNIDGELFAGCTSLDYLNVDTGNSVYDSRNNCNAIIETASDKLIYGCNNTAIPDDVNSIGARAFDSLKIKEILIPANIKTIGEEAFNNCQRLSSVELPEGLTNIGVGAFNNCIALEEITIPSSVVSLPYRAFSSCTSLNRVTVLSPDCFIDSSESVIPSSALICGLQNSTAQTYANTNNREFHVVCTDGSDIHSLTITGFDGVTVNSACSRCGGSFAESFAEHINETDCYYLDAVPDGIINAKDYSYLLKAYAR